MVVAALQREAQIRLCCIARQIEPVKYVPSHEKTGFLTMPKQRRRSALQLLLTAKLISAFVFATQIVQFLFFLNPKFQASIHLL